MRPTFSSRTLLVSVLSSIVPAVGLAQSRHAISFHLGRNDALPTEATRGGSTRAAGPVVTSIDEAGWQGVLGVRAGGALALGRVDRTANNADGSMTATRPRKPINATCQPAWVISVCASGDASTRL